MNLQNQTLFMVVAVVALLTPAPALFAQEKAFSGPYGGADIGRESIVGGSLVDGVDVLAQDDRTVASLLAGVRYQFGPGFVVGVEGSLGWMDGDLSLSDPVNGLAIDYLNGTQTTLGLIGGFVLGHDKNGLLFGYASEATRTFDVTIQDDGAVFQQGDEQGMLRYGFGVEKQVFGSVHLRAKAGTGRADFGDGRTNIDVESTLEFAAGLLFQF